MKKEIYILSKYNRYISLNKFLMCYFGVDINQIINSKLTHEDAKKIIPDLTPVTCNNISRESLARDLILVRDFSGDILLYKIPEFIEEIEVKNELNKENEKISIELKHEKIIQELKLYELLILKKRSKNCKDYKEIQKLIDTKKDKKSKQYKLRKEKLRRDDYNEEY